MNVAIIPARGGSRRIPLKNIRDFQGKPIVAYSILAAQESGLFDAVVVSTRHDMTAEVARKYGAEVHWRSQVGSRDETGTQEVAREVLEAPRYASAQFACCIYATAPLLLPQDLKDGYRLLTEPTDLGFHTHWWSYVSGWYYWGLRESFILGRPLAEKAASIIPEARWIDINTEEDWQRAERMYAAMKVAA